MSVSEFGEGVFYPLALFLAHQNGFFLDIRNVPRVWKTREDAAQMWLYGAADHLFGLQPDRAPEALRSMCESIRKRAMAWRLPCLPGERGPTVEECEQLLADTRGVFLQLDRTLGIESREANFP